MVFSPDKIAVSDFWQALSHKIAGSRDLAEIRLLIIDLDGTIVDYSLRTYKIFMEAADSLNLPDNLKREIVNSNPDDFHYYPESSLIEMGFKKGDLLTRMIKFWESNFLSNRFLHLDKPLERVREFVKNILNMGINIVYLTGRDDENMGEGTIDWLRRFHFLTDDRKTNLLMKTDIRLTNVQAKIAGCESIKSKKLGQPALIIDNEPGELEAVWRRFPDAIGVLMDTPNSGRPSRLPDATIRIKDFSTLNSLIKG